MEISNLYYKPYTPNFTSSSRLYYNKVFTKYTGNRVCTTTWMFRPDVDWDNLPQLMVENFKDKEHVNIYSVACSDGSEPYTVAISIMENLPQEQRNKFFPIIASDKDWEMIKVTKTNKINLSLRDFEVLEERTNPEHEYFTNEAPSIQIEEDEYCKKEYIHSYDIADELKNAVSFRQSDILKQIYRIRDNGNSVVMCRNVTPYLSQHYVNLLAEAVKKQLKPNSLLILGKFDEYTNFEELILDKNDGNPYFEEIDNNIYRRIDNSSFKNLGVEPQLDTNKCLLPIGTVIA